MRFLLDQMFPPATCGELARRGHDAVHVRDRGVAALLDRWAEANPDPYVGRHWP